MNQSIRNNLQNKLPRTQYYHLLMIVFGVLALSLAGSPASDIVQASDNVQASITMPVLSDGQFVYGPNVEAFDLDIYLQQSAPHLMPYRDSLYFYSLYPSINPKVILSLIEVQSGLVLSPNQPPSVYENPLGFSTPGFENQLEILANRLTQAYYWHLHNLTLSRLSSVVTTTDGVTLSLPPDLNAATYALLDAFAPEKNATELTLFSDRDQPNGFYQAYIRLFTDDPLDTSNQIDVYTLPPPNLLQVAFPVGEKWSFNGVHNWDGEQGTDMSSIDFSPGWPGWNVNTGNMWVVAAAPGTVTKRSNCWISINHGSGWETWYYHLENLQQTSGNISRNKRLANIANTYNEATCSGGYASGPHVHFTFRRNGALFPLDKVHLSGRRVHSGRSPYEKDCKYMYLEELLVAGIQKKCAFQSLLNEGIGPPFVDIPLDHWAEDWITLFHSEGYGNGLPPCDPDEPDNPYKFCLDNAITRAEMAVLLLQAKYGPNYTPPPATGNIFNDVPKTHWAAAWIEKLKTDEYTGGCSADPPLYCPDDSLTRAEMAVFLVRLHHGVSFTPPEPEKPHFVDVPAYWATKWIEQLWQDGLTAGCWLDPPRYCPENNVTRAEIATFLMKYLGLMPPGGGAGPEGPVHPQYLPLVLK